MPRKSDRLQFLQDLDLVLITSLAYVKNHQRKIPSRRIMASRISIPFVTTLVAALVDSSLQVSLAARLFSLLISTRQLQLARNIALRYEKTQHKTWQRTSALVTELIDLVLKHCYMATRLLRPRIATFDRTIEVLFQNNVTVFQRWVSVFLGVL